MSSNKYLPSPPLASDEGGATLIPIEAGSKGEFPKAPPGSIQFPIDEARREVFLAQIREHGVFPIAARAASPHLHTRHGPVTSFRNYIKRHPEFAAQVEEAREEYKGKVLQELHRRAVEGYDQPVYQGGAKVGKIRKYSDALLLAKVKSMFAEFRDKAQVQHQHEHAHIVADIETLKKISRESRDDLRRIILREGKELTDDS